MFKRFLATAALTVFLVPSALSAVTITKSEDITPENTLATLDISLFGKLKALLEPLIQKAADENKTQTTDEQKQLKLATLANKILAGDRFFVSASEMPLGALFSFPVTDEEFSIFTAGIETQHDYAGTTIYEERGAVMAKAGGFGVITATEYLPMLHQSIDLAAGSSTNSLSTDASYNAVSQQLLSPRLFGLTIDYKQLNSLIAPLASMAIDGSGPGGTPTETAPTNGVPQPTGKQIAEMRSLYGTIGISVADAPEGYLFNMIMNGNEEKLQQHGISLNATGNFTPSLHKKLPPAPTIFYNASFNPKAQNEMGKKMLGVLGMKDFDYLGMMGKQLGFDLNLLYETFEKELVIALQYTKDNPIPSFTILGDVNNRTSDGEKLMNELAGLLTRALEKDNVPFKQKKITANGGFLTFTLDVKDMKGYDGPPFQPITLTFGVTDDGLFIASNYPDIANPATRTGITMPVINDVTGATQINVREVWNFVDSMVEWTENVEGGKFAPPLEFYQEYYSVLQILYKWRELSLVTKGTETSMTLNGTVALDEAKHSTYEDFLKKLKAGDQDKDGVSDYDERYVYFTPVAIADSDGDGVKDFEELQKGMDPMKADARLFHDVGEEAYYTDEVSMLYQKGAIRGYSDGTFRPGQFVTRAEFATMVVNAFKENSSRYLGVDTNFKAEGTPFQDVTSKDWHYPYVAKAYDAKFISGSWNPSTRKLYFRPNDNITRAEALAILNKASEALVAERKENLRDTTMCTNNPFEDVEKNDWYCGAVSNGYKLGITTGKTPGKFAPNENIVRADAAIMIRRALEKDLAHLEKGTDSLSDFAAPLSTPLSGILPY